MHCHLILKTHSKLPLSTLANPRTRQFHLPSQSADHGQGLFFTNHHYPPPSSSSSSSFSCFKQIDSANTQRAKCKVMSLNINRFVKCSFTPPPFVFVHMWFVPSCGRSLPTFNHSVIHYWVGTCNGQRGFPLVTNDDDRCKTQPEYWWSRMFVPPPPPLPQEGDPERYTYAFAVLTWKSLVGVIVCDINLRFFLPRGEWYRQNEADAMKVTSICYNLGLGNVLRCGRWRN